MERYYEEVIKGFKEEQVINFLQRMIRINTTNPPGNEKELAGFLAEYLTTWGLQAEIKELEEGRANLMAIYKGKGTKRALLYNGHLDTVAPGNVSWKYPPFSGELHGGKIYGRGTSDMKSGLAAMALAAGLIARSGIQLEGDLVIVGTAGEEVDSLGAKALLKDGIFGDFGAAVIAEPSENRLFTSTKGALWLRLDVRGKTAHGSMPEEGVNAIHSLYKLVEEIYRLNFLKAEHPVLGRPTINLGTIEGGLKTNMVPDRCTATIDVRTVPGQNHDEIVEEIRELISKSSVDAVVKIINNRPPVETSGECHSVKIAQKVHAELFNRELKPEGVTYYTDASVWVPETNLPTFIYGPGKAELAHRPDEYVEVDKLAAAVKFFVAFALEYLK